MRLTPTHLLSALFALLLPVAATEASETCGALTTERAELLARATFESELPSIKLTDDVEVASVHIVRQDIFPNATHRLARVANSLNVVSRDSTIRSALTIEPGQRIGAAELAEAERVLRRKPFLYDARVLVRAVCDGRAVLDVVVRDVWTLVPNASFARSGGDNKTIFGVSDNNLLGYGKDVFLLYRRDRDRSGFSAGYTDPNIAGSRWQGQLRFADNDDGHAYSGRLSRPFYALDTRWSAGLRAHSFEREQDLELLSDDVFQIDGEGESADLFVGRSSGTGGRFVDRFWLGLAFSEERYDFPTDFPDAQRIERRFVYPYVAWNRQEDRFVTRENVERIQRTEDLELGWFASARLGVSTDASGGDGDFALYSARLGGRWYVRDDMLFTSQLATSGRLELTEQDTQDSVTQANAELIWKHSERMSFLLRGEFTLTRDLDLENQLTQGGDSDLRGYPSRYQVGDRRFLATIEERYYTDWYPFGLFRVGFAVFADAGRAWFEDEPPSWVSSVAADRDDDHFDVLANVGFGLRLESTRTRRDRVLHIDFARPLIDGPDVDSFQVTISAKRAL